VYDVVPIGSYSGSASPYGTFDQGGNVYEWNEQVYISGSNRQSSGGNFYDAGDRLVANAGDIVRYATDHHPGLGFRLAMVPEPGTGLLVIAGLLGLAGGRGARD
jgi:formylglycine-generating enzyme required for sulfatase activity